MTRAFVRQLGRQPGVQLNPLRDETDSVARDNSDQVVAVLARATRGRIDKPFPVNRGNFLALTGPAEAIRVNALNEAKLQGYEALENGAYELLFQRLVSAAATKSFAVLNFSGTPAGSANTVAFSTASTAPTSGFSIYLMHHLCHNDGIKVALHADATPLTGVAQAATNVTLRVMDVNGNVLNEFRGSLDPLAKDDFGISMYLPDVAAQLSGGEVEVWVAAGATVPTTSNAYGRGLSQKDNWAISDVLSCFNEGGTTYTDTDFDVAIRALRDSSHQFGYIISGGTKSLSLIGKLASLAIETNTILKLDIDGNLSPSQAIAFDASLSLDSHLVHKNWAPLRASDPLNGGVAVWGAGGLQAGYACARNARVNALGFAPKNEPIAGYNWPVSRQGIVQLVQLQDQQEDDLARAQINPVIFQTYNGGGKYVFNDCLTSAKTEVSYRKLQPVAEMSTDIDAAVTMAAKQFMHSPMKLFVKKMTDFLAELLQGAQASDWLKPSKKLPGNAAFSFSVGPNRARPADVANIDLWISYDGVARQIVVQQTLVN